jgi:hypothetical protein
VTNISLNENEDEKCIYIILSNCWVKIDENVIVFVTHDVVYAPLDTMWHLIQLEL